MVFECLSDRIQRSSRGYHIIDDDDRFSGKIGMTGKGMPNVVVPHTPGQHALRRGFAYAYEAGCVEREIKGIRQRTGDFHGLIESAFAQSLRRQGYRQDKVTGRRWRRQQAAGKKVGNGEAVPELESLYQMVDGIGVTQRGMGGVENRRLVQAIAAGGCGCGQGGGATWAARPGQARQVGGAAGTKSRMGSSTAEQAAMRQQGIDDRVGK